MVRALFLPLISVALLLLPACKGGGGDPVPSLGAEGAAVLAQIASAAGDDAAIVVALRPAGWPAVRDALVKIPEGAAPPAVLAALKADSLAPLLAELVDAGLAEAVSGPDVRLACGLGVVRGANTSRVARFLAAVVDGRPVAAALGDARGRCAVAGVPAADLMRALDGMGLAALPTGVAGAKAWRSPAGLFLTAREDAGVVVVAGRLAPSRDADAPQDVDALVRALLAPPPPAAETPALRALARPGSVGGVMLRSGAARRLGAWVGLRELAAVVGEIPEAERMRAVAQGAAIALSVDRVVPRVPPDAEDTAFVVAGEDGRLIMTATQSLTAHGARVVDAALGVGARVRAPKMMPPGVAIGVRFDPAARQVVDAAAGGDAGGASLEALSTGGVWGYAALLGHGLSLAAMSSDQATGLLDEVAEPSSMAPEELARWSIDVTQAQRVFDLGLASPARLGVKRVDGVVRRSGGATVARWVASFGDATEPSLATSDAGAAWAGAEVTPAARCREGAELTFAGLLEDAAGRVPTADLATGVLKLAEAKGCLGGDADGVTRLDEMLWAAKMVLARRALDQWDRATATVVLAGACDQDVLPAACALMRESSAGPDVGLVDVAEGCDGTPRGVLLRVVPRADGLETWIEAERVPTPELAARAKGAAGADGRVALLADPKLTVGALAPVLDALADAGLAVFVGVRVAGGPSITRLRWERAAQHADGEVLKFAPSAVWGAVLAQIGTTCVARLRLAAPHESVELDAGQPPEGGGETGAPAPAVALESVTVRGFCERRQVEEVVRRRLSAFGYCAEKSAARAGVVAARFTIDLAGGVTAASVVENTIGSDDAGQCITQLFRRMRFPAPEGGICIVLAKLTVKR